MGRATRWLKNLITGKNKDTAKESNTAANGFLEKRRFSFKSVRSSADLAAETRVPRLTSKENVAYFSSIYSEEGEARLEQSKHAIAVAAATAAAADAAVAAAHAAVAVVRLTSSRGRGGGALRERERAALKIQAVFRGFLAKKALRALKALVKLQALVRGYLVRRQAAATLHSMQALIRAQATVRSHRSHPRKSLERFDETRSEHIASFHSRRMSGNLDNTSTGIDRSPKTVEIDTYHPKSRPSRHKTAPCPFEMSNDETTLKPISIPECRRNFNDQDWFRYPSTAQSTPQYMHYTCFTPATPAKSLSSADRVLPQLLPNCAPNYMSNTQSFEAKVRSQSTPRQRPETTGLMRRRVPLSEVLVGSRASLSGVGMQSSCARAQEIANDAGFGYSRSDEIERDFYLQKKW